MTGKLQRPGVLGREDATASQRINRRPRLLHAGLLLFLLLLTGCGQPFHVKSRASLPPATYTARIQADGVEIKANAITDEDFLYGTFDANLILAGLLPVRLMITNTGEQPLNLKKAEWEIKDETGKTGQAIDPQRAFKRLISYYEIRSYNKDGYNKSREGFVSYALDRTAPLEPGASRDGFLFFAVPPGVAREPGLMLEVRGLRPGEGQKKASVSLRLK